MLQDLTIKEFLNKTAGSDPVPGGGSISALCGALAAALAQMVAGLTIGRKKYAEAEAEMIEIARRMADAREHFLKYIDDDANAYDVVFQAFKMPKDTDEEKAARSAAIQAATVKAAEVPLEVAATAVGIMDAIQAVAERGNQNAITDACVAMMCARTAALGAILNVRINLASLTDEAIVADMTARCDMLQTTASDKERHLLTTVKI